MESPVTPFIPIHESSPEVDIIEDQHTQSPLRKRARRTSISIDITASESTSQSLVMASEESKEPVRDDTYYMADGSCVLRVQNTLFKVHRTILSKDQSFFGPMFTLPQGDFGAEGMSDDHPIVLQGDTAEEFRHFLWALYALPSELIIVRSPQADLSRLIDIAKVSSKYSFKSTETWALDAIQEYLERNTSPLFNDNPLIRMFPTLNTRSSALLESEGQIARLIRLAQMCSHSRLMDTMIQLLQKLMSGSLHYSYLAMTLADEFNLRDLRGAAYLGVMQTSVFVCPGVGIGHTYVEGDIQETSEGPQRWWSAHCSSLDFCRDITAFLRHGTNCVLFLRSSNTRRPAVRRGTNMDVLRAGQISGRRRRGQKAYYPLAPQMSWGDWGSSSRSLTSGDLQHICTMIASLRRDGLSTRR